jgi:phosphatidyl-myo-inositol alpha-mannosyltransferase
MRLRLTRTALWIAGVAALIFLLDLVGIPVSDWIGDLFDKIAQVPPGAVIGGVVLETLQTTFAALAWLAILRAAFPNAGVSFRVVLASYAAAVAMNDFLPANIGTWAMLFLFTAVIAGATLPAVFSGLLVQKIPFSIFNIALYLYLFLSVSSSLSIDLGVVSSHPVAVALIAVGAVVLLALLARIFWRRTEKLRAQLVAGGAVLRDPRKALVTVALPELGSYLARLGIVAVFLGAYSIPVTFHNVATVTASNSVANSVSVTPGGVGVTQAANTAALRDSTSSSNATAYSIAQQLIVSAWDAVFAVAMISWAFGWSGGKELVQTSYDEAKERTQEMKEERAAKRRARRTGEA